MTKKNENTPKLIEDRLHLLALVASNVASGVVAAPSPSTATADGIAEISIEIAEAILKRAGI